jgi:hypothetical protein
LLLSHKRGQVYHYRGTVAGRRLRGSCGTADRTQAQKFAAEVESQSWQRGVDSKSHIVAVAF